MGKQWKHRLDLADVWERTEANDGDLTVQQTARIVADRLRAIIPELRIRNTPLDNLTDIIMAFDGLSEDEGADGDWDALDYCMDSLYDWADVNRRMSINTFSVTE